MKRRELGVMAASGAVALSAGMAKPARAGVPADKAAMLKSTLTPMGAEMAGNADGSIPAWSGGVTTMPAGWSASMNSLPDMFANETPVVIINAANMSQYADQLTDGLKVMMTKFPDYSIHVYPTHRTASAPQAIYDNIYQNALNTALNPKGGRFGFSGGYGGIPFPIPDDDPENAGVQIIWNHLCRWFGYNYNRLITSFVVSGGVPALGAKIQVYQENTYYNPGGSATNYDGVLYKLRANFTGPPVYNGEQEIQIQSTNPLENPVLIWELLPGQSRVRKAPELAYDTPAQPLAGVGNYDEIIGFFGAPDRYNWKLLGKKEMFIPYNNNGLFYATPEQVLGPHFVNPQYVRWEKHRVWVVDATLAPGERNVIPHRRFYIDEDTWTIGVVDGWDAQGNFWRLNMNFLELRPDLPALIYAKGLLYNVQSGDYVLTLGPWQDASLAGPLDTSANSSQLYNPSALAAQSQF